MGLFRRPDKRRRRHQAAGKHRRAASVDAVADDFVHGRHIARSFGNAATRKSRRGVARRVEMVAVRGVAGIFGVGKFRGQSHRGRSGALSSSGVCATDARFFRRISGDLANQNAKNRHRNLRGTAAVLVGDELFRLENAGLSAVWLSWPNE